MKFLEVRVLEVFLSGLTIPFLLDGGKRTHVSHRYTAVKRRPPYGDGDCLRRRENCGQIVTRTRRRSRYDTSTSVAASRRSSACSSGIFPFRFSTSNDRSIEPVHPPRRPSRIQKMHAALFINAMDQHAIEQSS